ncbi:hypothetical protein F4167_11705 [Candidatus Poribacteria bacterium]|nr:hypothetical protein [Candidatus Poribacteria bacterium]MYG07257.1 hypothetical protein [Candidatus Poribacteria bacterium]MYK18197.1 hypothetical protein [Candidatus Poribacteria bacterium]
MSGSYGYHILSIINIPEERNRFSYGITAHELAHARQHAVSIIHGTACGVLGTDWGGTPEGEAYRVAWEKDLEEAPGKLYILDENEYYESNLSENNAEFCSYYWFLGAGLNLFHDKDPVQGMQERAPNRFKWAQEYLDVHP